MHIPPLPDLVPEINKERQNDYPKEGPQGKFLLHTVNWLKQAITYSGIIALITVVSSAFFLVNAEEGKTKKIGDCLGNCYVIVELLLVGSIIAFIALKIFFKLRGS
jgi:hypothetical protein